jgi:kumamolisin
MTDPTVDDAEKLDLRPLPGSDRVPVPGARATGQPLPADTPIGVTLVLRRRADVPDSAAAGHLSRSELAERYGADPADVATITEP